MTPAWRCSRASSPPSAAGSISPRRCFPRRPSRTTRKPSSGAPGPTRSASAGPRASSAFAGAARVIDLYADDLQGRMRLAAARAAIAERDFGYADAQLSDIAMLHPGAVPQEEVDLLRAPRRQERPAAWNSPSAELGRLRPRRRRARSRPRRSSRACRSGWSSASWSPARAIEALERLTILWRGDSTEIEAMGLLGRLYAEGGPLA